MTQANYNHETWTDRDKAFLDAARKLKDEELEFLANLMQLVNEDPQKKAARVTFAEQQADNYKLRTAEGRTFFLDALRAV